MYYPSDIVYRPWQKSIQQYAVLQNIGNIRNISPAAAERKSYRSFDFSPMKFCNHTPFLVSSARGIGKDASIAFSGGFMRTVYFGKDLKERQFSYGGPA